MLIDLVFNWMNLDQPFNPKLRCFLAFVSYFQPYPTLTFYLPKASSLPTYFLYYPPSFVPPSLTIELHIINHCPITPQVGQEGSCFSIIVVFIVFLLHFPPIQISIPLFVLSSSFCCKWKIIGLLLVVFLCKRWVVTLLIVIIIKCKEHLLLAIVTFLLQKVGSSTFYQHDDHHFLVANNKDLQSPLLSFFCYKWRSKAPCLHCFFFIIVVLL